MNLQEIETRAAAKIEAAARTAVVYTADKKDLKTAVRQAIQEAISEAYSHGVEDGKAEGFANW